MLCMYATHGPSREAYGVKMSQLRDAQSVVGNDIKATTPSTRFLIRLLYEVGWVLLMQDLGK
jgi:hypothetical protein